MPASRRARVRPLLASAVVVLVALAVAAAAEGMRHLAWPHARTPVSVRDRVLALGAVTWALPAGGAVAMLAGLVAYPWRRRPAAPPARLDLTVCFRIVTRGTNPDAVVATVDAVHTAMAARPRFDETIEVVTDVDLGDRLGDRAVVQLVVPDGYRTPHGARFKARALQFALDASHLPLDAWIVHLDEESHPTPSMIDGVATAIAEEEASGALRIGQGMILYHRDLDRHPFLTLADMVRTGDDAGRFHLQHTLGRPLFGLHGSFIVVRHDVERSVGFDFGPEGSITEDAFWAYAQTSGSRRVRWVDGYLLEQAPRSATDLVRQRRRWYSGMVKVLLHAPMGLARRALLGSFMTAWALSWLGVAYFVVNLWLGLATPLALRVCAEIVLASTVLSYGVGLVVNLRHRGWPTPGRTVALLVAQVALIPVFGVMEAAAVIGAVVRPERGFAVIAK